MSCPSVPEKARSLSRPRAQAKNVSSCSISIGPRSASATTLGVIASTLSIRALISTLRAPRFAIGAAAVITVVLACAARPPREIHHVRILPRLIPRPKADRLVEARGRLIVGAQAKALESVSRRLDDPRDQPPAHAVPAQRRQYVEVADSADTSIAGVRIDVETAHAYEPAGDQGGEQRLSQPVEPVCPIGPLVDESADDPRSGRFAVGEQLTNAVCRQVVQPLEEGGARFAPASEWAVKRAAEPGHRRLRVMTTSTTSNPGDGDAALLKDTDTEYPGPKSEPVTASISRLVWSLNRRNVSTG